eukprot:jgi/Tetstr1/449053/TSEL_036268.t1
MAASGEHAEKAVLELCREHPEGLPENVLEKELAGFSISQKAAAINSLLQQHRLQMLQGADTLLYKEVVSSEAVRFKGLGSEDMLVYQVIHQAGNIGIWTKDLKHKSNLQQPQVAKILKTLESRKLVKSVKSVTSGNKKLYMLFELEPSREVTGGAWYTEQEFDSEFIEALREACFRYIDRQGDATLTDISAFIATKGFSKVDLRDEDVLSIVNTLVYDGRVDCIEDEEETEHFRPAMLSIPKQSAFTALPCGVCPVFNECTIGGPISPATCAYFDRWLDF